MRGQSGVEPLAAKKLIRMAVQVLQMELTNPVPLAIENRYEQQRVLVRFQNKPVGWITLEEKNSSFLSVTQLKQAVAGQLAGQVAKLAFAKEAGFATQETVSDEAISVVVCTRNRTQSLAVCLKELLLLEYERFEVIVVDNAPANDETFRMAKAFPVRYVREERPGLDRARNRGLTEARYGIVAFIDDDALADRFWLQAIAKNFALPEVMAVTGYVAPAELETEAQRLFEFNRGGMGHGFTRRFLRRETLTPKQLLWASNFGVGTNMAFRKSVFETAGLFDTALDVGTPANGGGDVEMFHRLVARGHLLVYDPAVLVWHRHRRQMAGLQKQMADNGKSFCCYLMTCYRNRTVSRPAILNFFFLDILLHWSLKNLLRPKGASRRLTLMELKGMLASPWAYRQSQRRAKQMARKEKDAEEKRIPSRPNKNIV